MGYKIMEVETLREALRNKPQWVSCATFTTAVFAITLSAVTVGVFLGYTYCYIEHRNEAATTRNITRSTNLQIVHMPYPNTEEGNRTVNGTVVSNVVLSTILKFGRALIDDNLECIPYPAQELDNTTEPVLDSKL